MTLTAEVLCYTVTYFNLCYVCKVFNTESRSRSRYIPLIMSMVLAFSVKCCGSKINSAVDKVSVKN